MCLVTSKLLALLDGVVIQDSIWITFFMAFHFTQCIQTKSAKYNVILLFILINSNLCNVYNVYVMCYIEQLG